MWLRLWKRLFGKRSYKADSKAGKEMLKNNLNRQ